MLNDKSAPGRAGEN